MKIIRNLIKFILALGNFQLLVLFVLIWVGYFDNYSLKPFIQKYITISLFVIIIGNIIYFVYSLIRPEKIKVIPGPMGPMGARGVNLCRRCKNYEEKFLDELLSEDEYAKN